MKQRQEMTKVGVASHGKGVETRSRRGSITHTSRGEERAPDKRWPKGKTTRGLPGGRAEPFALERASWKEQK